MTQIDTSREAVEALLQGVTEGPWWVGAQNDALFVINATPSPAPYDGPIPKDYGANVVCTPNWRDMPCNLNARFIAAARELVPALLARAEAEETALTETEALELQHGAVIERLTAALAVANEDADRLAEALKRQRAATVRLQDNWSDGDGWNKITAFAATYGEDDCAALRLHEARKGGA